MNMTFSDKTKKRILVASVFAGIWCVALIYSVATLKSAKKATEQARATLSHIAELAPEANAKRAYNAAELTIRDLVATETDLRPIDALVKHFFPSAPAPTVENRADVLSHSMLRVRHTTLKWDAIDTELLSEIVNMAESRKVPFRLTELTVTPTPTPDTVRASATFVTFTK